MPIRPVMRPGKLQLLARTAFESQRAQSEAGIIQLESGDE